MAVDGRADLRLAGARPARLFRGGNGGSKPAAWPIAPSQQGFAGDLVHVAILRWECARAAGAPVKHSCSGQAFIVGPSLYDGVPARPQDVGARDSEGQDTARASICR
jgi:hypothetical protein